MAGNIECVIKYKTQKKAKRYTAELSQWLKGQLDFTTISKATFTENMCLAVLEFDQDHCIYILVPESIFSI